MSTTDTEATSTPEAANDNEPAEAEPTPELEASNENPQPQGAELLFNDDNSPAEELPATGND